MILLREFSAFFTLIALVNIVIGAIECFFGYRLFKITLALVGFGVGALLAGGLGYGASGHAGAAALYALIGGVIGAILFVVLYFLGVFALGALLGFFAGELLFIALGVHPSSAILLILAVLGGIAAILLQKLIIILSTAFGGAWGVVAGIASLLQGSSPSIYALRGWSHYVRARASLNAAEILAWLLLGTVGVIVQYRWLPKKEREQKAQEEINLPWLTPPED